MTKIYLLDEKYLLIFALFVLLNLLSSVVLTVRSFYLKSDKKIKITNIVLLVLEAILFQSLSYINFEKGIVNEDKVSKIIGNYPYIIMILIIIFTSVINELILLHIRAVRKSSISQKSIKDAIDNLPLGILVYLESGVVLIVNKIMNDIAYEINNYFINDGNKLYNHLLKYKVENEEENVLKINNKYYLLRRNKIDLYNPTNTYELLLVNISEEYQINLKLKEESDYLLKYNEDLKKYKDNIVKVTTEEEILNTKIKIHDKLGELLLLSKNIDENSSKEEIRYIVNQWKETYNQLGNYQISDNNVSYLDDLVIAGNAIGVTINVDGDVPNNSIVYTMIHECLTNTFKHGQGTIMNVVTRTMGNYFYVTCSNNGKIKKKIEFKGGLKSLKDLVIKNNGKLEQIDNDLFTIQLMLPLGGMINGKN